MSKAKSRVSEAVATSSMPTIGVRHRSLPMFLARTWFNCWREGGEASLFGDAPDIRESFHPLLLNWSGQGEVPRRLRAEPMVSAQSGRRC